MVSWSHSKISEGERKPSEASKNHPKIPKMSEDKSFVIIIKLNDLLINKVFLIVLLRSYFIVRWRFHPHLQLIEHVMF